MKKEKYTAMKSVVMFVSILFILGLNAEGQNLIPNNSFETYSSCPNWSGQIDTATGWTSLENHLGTPNYLHTCGTSILSRVPDNNWGWQHAQDGSAYAYLYMYSVTQPERREYMQTQLSSALTAGKTYDISFYVSLSDYTGLQCNNFGCYFSDTAIKGTGDGFALTSYTPQFEYTSRVSDTSDWVLISGSFVASGGEEYITIGNFRDDAGTDIVSTGTGTLSSASYYFDNFSLTENSVPVELLTFKAWNEEGKHHLKWVTASETNNDYFAVERSYNGIDFEWIETVDGHGSSNAEHIYQLSLENSGMYNGPVYYRLKQTDFDGSYTYSDVVLLSAQRESAERNLRVFPNPVSINSPVNLNFKDVNVDKIFSIQIINLQGQVVLEKQLTMDGSNHASFTIDSDVQIAPGTYHIVCFGNGHVLRERFMML